MSRDVKGQQKLEFFDPPSTLVTLVADPTARHILRNLNLPDRFERLDAILGPRTAQLLVEPAGTTLDALRDVAQHCRSRGEGILIPIIGPTGQGKTTFANSLATFLPDAFAPTLRYASPIERATLVSALELHAKSLKADDTRLIPIAVDDREGTPPTDEELAIIKSLVREATIGYRSVVLWPAIRPEVGKKIAEEYQTIVGKAIIDLPLEVNGPPREAWPTIARQTMEIVNEEPNVTDLGIDPKNYEPDHYPTIGEYLRAISHDFVKLVNELSRSSAKRVNVVIIFASESVPPGILSQLTASKRYGLLDASALLDATGNSDIGRWWKARRGLLTTTIIRLNARCFGLSPSASVSVLSRYGPPDVAKALQDAGRDRMAPSQVNERLLNTDLGRFLTGSDTAVVESRGGQQNEAVKQLQTISSGGIGYTKGRDKQLNAAMREAVEYLLKSKDIVHESVMAETSLGFNDVIPDNAVHYAEEVVCLEYTWRSGDFLVATHRSDIAQYVLTKLRNYAYEFGWAER